MSTGPSTARAARLLFWPAVAFALLFEVHRLALPPHGEHAWRDADGIGVARSFLRDGWNLLEPRVAERADTSGIAGMEFPLLPWLSALLQKLIGENYFTARAVAWLSIIALALGVRALARRVLADETAADLAAAFLALQPLALVYSRKLMPEVPMLALIVWGAALAWDALHQGRALRGLAAGGLLALAAVMKPTGAAVAVPIGIWTFRALLGPRPRAALVRAALIASPPVLAVALWFAHARTLDAAGGGLPHFKLEHDWLDWTRQMGNPTFHSVVFGRVLHLYLLVPFAIWMALRPRLAWAALTDRAETWAWTLAALALIVLFGSHNFQHAYYSMGVLPPLCLWLGSFVARAAPELPGLRARAPLAIALSVAVFAATAAIRAMPRFPPLGYDPGAVQAAMARFPRALTVATDERTPVVSLVVVDRFGWSLPAATLTKERLAELRSKGARLLVESIFGGWLPDGARAALPAPAYQDPQLRVYQLP